MPALLLRFAIDAVRVDEATFVLDREFKRNSVAFPLAYYTASAHFEDGRPRGMESADGNGHRFLP
jgi:hypothetical protein